MKGQSQWLPFFLLKASLKASQKFHDKVIAKESLLCYNEEDSNDKKITIIKIM
jgi:hypothetical protein